jgi:hypothetical protein
VIVPLRRDGAAHAAGAASLLMAALVTAVLGLAACHRSALPEKGTYPERLYAARCGQCHAPYDPRTMTAAMWQVQMHVMEGTMAAAGRRPLTPAERKTITDYVTRNAGRD